MHGRNRPFFFNINVMITCFFLCKLLCLNLHLLHVPVCVVGWQQAGVGAWSIIKSESLCESVPWGKTHEGMCAPWDKTGNGQLRQARPVQDRTRVDPLPQYMHGLTMCTNHRILTGVNRHYHAACCNGWAADHRSNDVCHVVSDSTANCILLQLSDSGAHN